MGRGRHVRTCYGLGGGAPRLSGRSGLKWASGGIQQPSDVQSGPFPLITTHRCSTLCNPGGVVTADSARQV